MEQAGLSRNPVMHAQNGIAPMNRGDDRLTFETVASASVLSDQIPHKTSPRILNPERSLVEYKGFILSIRGIVDHLPAVNTTR